MEKVDRGQAKALGRVFGFVLGSVLILALLAAFSIGTVYAGNALDFDGINDYVAANGYDTETFSISAWVKLPEQVAGWAGIVEFTPEGSTNRRGLLLSGPGGPDIGSPTIVYGVLNYRVSNEGDIDDSAWHHIAGTYDGLEPKLYVDGEPVSLGPEGNTAGGPLTSALTIGTWTDTLPPSSCFPGVIDEVRVWNIARTQEDIQSSMHRVLTGNEPGLVGYWRFDEEPGAQTAVDLSPSCNHGTLTNMDPATDWVESDAPLAYTGSLNGYVTNLESNPIKWAFIIAVDAETKDKYNDFSNSDGYYEIPELPPAMYWVICIKKGYKTGIAKVTVESGKTTTKDFQLCPT